MNYESLEKFNVVHIGDYVTVSNGRIIDDATTWVTKGTRRAHIDNIKQRLLEVVIPHFNFVVSSNIVANASCLRLSRTRQGLEL